MRPLTVDEKLRKSFLKKLEPILHKERGFDELSKWNGAVGLSKNNSQYDKEAPNKYFDSLLPKTAGGLWHEILVYCFLLRYNIGYICLTAQPKIKDQVRSIKYWDELKRLNVLLSKEKNTILEEKEKTELQIKLKSKYSFLKTHSIFYMELKKLYDMSRGEILDERMKKKLTKNR